MAFRVLGPMEVTRAGRPVPVTSGKLRILLATLLLNANRSVTTQYLIDRLSDTGEPVNARATVHIYVRRLRQMIGDDSGTLIRTGSGGYSIEIRPGNLDVASFTDLVRQAATVGDRDKERVLLADALALWRGPALVDVPSERLRLEEPTSLTEQWVGARERLTELDSHDGPVPLGSPGRGAGGVPRPGHAPAPGTGHRSRSGAAGAPPADPHRRSGTGPAPRRRTGTPEREAAAELARLCGHLPLALRIAAANLAATPALRIEHHVARLRRGDLLGALTIGDDRRLAVRAAFDLSYESLSAPVQRMFRLLGAAPLATVDPWAAAALLGTALEEATTLLDGLARANLVQRGQDGRFGIHDLLRRYAAELCAADARLLPLERGPDRLAHRGEGGAARR